LIALLLRVSAAVNNPSAGNVASLIGEARTGWSDIIAPGKQDDEAADPFGGQVTFRLKAEVANALRQCEERGVDADRLRGAVTEIELLLDELVGDDVVVVDAVQDPDRFEKVISERVQRRRRNVEAKSEPFFDALVRAVTEEFVRRAPRSESFRIGALRQLLDGIKEILEYLALIEEYILESESGPGSPRPSRIRLGSRPMEAVGFVERREQARLSDAVFAGASGRTVLTGMRGSGKSQLATAVAARCEAQGWPLVAWVPAGSREAVLSGLVELGLELGVRVEDGPSREVIARRCLTALASAQGSNRLIVFDDVKNPDDLVGHVGAVHLHALVLLGGGLGRQRLAVRQRRCSAVRGPAFARAGAHGRGEGLPARIQQCLSTQLSLLAQLFGIRHRSAAAAWCGTGQLAHAQAPVPVSPLGRTWGGSRAPACLLAR